MLLVSSLVYSQNKTSIDPLLEPYVLSYVNDGIERGYNPISDILKNVDSIVVDYKLNYPNLGYYDSKNKSIHIASFTFIDKLIVRSTVYHELTHGVTLNNGHVCFKCGDIMSQHSPDTFSKYAIREIWSKAVDNLFTLIKDYKKNKYEI